MKKAIMTILGFLVATNVYAATLLDKTEDTAPTADDMMYCVNSPGGTPADRKCTVGNVAKGMTVTNMVSACTDAQVLGGNAGGTGVECQADVDTNANTICTGTTTYLDGEGNCDTLNAGTDITADLEEDAHCSEHDSTDVDCTGETIIVVDDQHAHTTTTISGIVAADMGDADHGQVSWTTNVATVEDMTCTDCINDTEIATNAGTALSADLEEEAHTSEHAVSGDDTVFPADPNADRVLQWDDDPGNLAWISCATLTGSADLCDGNDATGAGGGDAITVNTIAATDANFLDNIYVDFELNTTPAPDDITSKFNYNAASGDHALLTTEGAFAANGLVFEGTTADTIELYLAIPDPATTDKTITFPNATDTLVGKDTTDILTNKTIAAADNVVTSDDLICTDCIDDTEVTTNAGTALSADLEEEAHCSEHDSADLDCSTETLVYAADSLDFTEIVQSNTLAGDPALAVDECFLVATATGGGFICEGSTADTNEMLHLFPDENEADTTRRIVLDTATQTLTNKTLTAAGNAVEADDLICTNCIDDTEVTTGAGTALSDDLEEETHGSEHDGTDGDYVTDSGDTMAGNLTLSDGSGASPSAIFTPQTGTAWSIYTEDTGDDIQIESNTASTETVDIANAGAGVANLEVDGTINGATAITEAGNAVYNSSETPGGSLGGTWASPTIDDLFLLNNGDAGVGDYDFGVSTQSFEIPNGATVTDPNVAGEVAIDTTTDQFLYYGGAQRVLHYENINCGALRDATTVGAANDYPIFTAPAAGTIVAVSCQVTGTSATVDFEDDADTAIESAMACDVSTPSAWDETIAGTATFVKGEAIEFDVTASSAATSLLACVRWVRDAD